MAYYCSRRFGTFVSPAKEALPVRNLWDPVFWQLEPSRGHRQLQRSFAPPTLSIARRRVETLSTVNAFLPFVHSPGADRWEGSLPRRGGTAIRLDSPGLPDPRAGALAAEGSASARDIRPFHGERLECLGSTHVR